MTYPPDGHRHTGEEIAIAQGPEEFLHKAAIYQPHSRYSDVYPSESLSRITGVRLPDKHPSTLWDLSIHEGRVSAIDSHDPDSASCQASLSVLDGAGRLLAPSLCHAHIHLDKCFLLQDPKFSDLQIERGDFQEAMELTGKAKSRFEEEDLLRRGRQLIEESIHHGVTCMRAFVEVDGGVLFKCLDAGLQLKEEFQERCHVQICAFAQLPIFSGSDGGLEVRRLMTAAAERVGVDVVGSTPYVEEDLVKSRMNVEWITRLALSRGKHLDLHLDYFLEKDRPPLVFTVLDIIHEHNWPAHDGKHITLGHCTRLTRFNESEWQRLKRAIGSLPVSFVGLPTSDLFMMRTQENFRGTLPIVQMIKELELDAAIAVNNVGNAFTPQGHCDPLSVASLGVGLYQAGTKRDSEILYEAVSWRAKHAIGCRSTSVTPRIGEAADLVLFDSVKTGWRCRKSIAELVYDPLCHRQTIRGGKIVAC